MAQITVQKDSNNPKTLQVAMRSVKFSKTFSFN